MMAATCSQGSLEAVIRALGERTGLSFAPNRYDHAELGIRRAMARAGMADPVRYRELIESDSGALDGLINELTVGETYFFREPAQFEFVRGEWLPEITRAKGAEHPLRVWSAGCASGEEAYSLAILLEQENRAGQAHIVATDISRAALAKARQAAYSTWSLRGEGADLAWPYLTRTDDRWVLNDRIRQLVSFEYLNLALDAYPSLASGICGLDLILCRNVLIYFDPETIRQVARRLFASLAEGGCLLCGPSDPVLTDLAPFQVTAAQAGLVYRRGKAAENPARPSPVLDRPGEPSAPAIPQRDVDSPARPAQRPASAASRTKSGPLPRWSEAVVRPSIHDEAPTEVRAAPPMGTLSEARQALAQADYPRVVVLTEARLEDLDASLLHIQALANLDIRKAEQACRIAVGRHRLAVEIHYLHALLLLQLGCDAAAVRAARHVIYLDRSLAVAHFTLGSLLRKIGDLVGANRAYRNARELAATRPADEVIPLSDGERAGRLVEAAEAQLALIDLVPCA